MSFLKEYFLNQEKRFTTLELYAFVISLGIVFFFVALLLDMNINWKTEWAEIVKAIASVAILASIIIAILNYKYVKKWNQQKAAVDALHNSKKLLKDHIQTLDKEIDIQQNLTKFKIFTIEELHNFIGVFMEDGSFIFHGEQSKDNTKYIHTKDNGYTKKFEHDRGREIYESIEAVLNEYEYLCMASNQGIFYRKTIIALRGTGILRVFNLFSNHIYHLRYDERHGYGPRLYEQLEKFSEEIASTLKLEINKPKKDDYSSAFDKKN